MFGEGLNPARREALHFYTHAFSNGWRMCFVKPILLYGDRSR